MSDQSSSSDRLVRVETSVDSLNEKVDRVLYALEGNGTPGLKVRVDRLEQNEESRKWWMGMAITATIGGLLLTLWNGIKVMMLGKV
jgi:hypothetical protein